jgi:uncharacterized membrane protein YgcG
MDKISAYKTPGRYRLHLFFVFFIFFCAGFVARAAPARANPIIAAYQQVYSMNFEVCRPEGLPLGWFATFDGYPVAQVSPNHWVYGRVERRGSIVPTSVAVGAVAPMDVPELARVALPSWRSGAYETKAFQSIASSGLDNIGVLDDPLTYTPVAWKAGKAELHIWMSDRWYRLVPAGGQSVSQALQARHPYIVRTLRKKSAYDKSVLWTMSDTEELADLARSWGYLWHGPIPFASLTLRREDAESSGSGSAWDGEATGTAPIPSGEWDIGGGGGGGSGGGSGWDTGGSPSGGGGGWDSGGSTGGGSGSGGNGGSSGGGGGWDK